ncbi:MAG TPA: Trm112 family protein [bacterium]
MLPKELIEILVCPKCKGELQYKTEPHEFICPACRLKYSVKDDIPNFLIEEAESF